MNTKVAKVSPSNLNSLIELYVSYFNRISEASGLTYWIDGVAAGESLAQVSQDFCNFGIQLSSVTGYTASMSNADFNEIVNSNVLGRPGSTAPSAGEVQYWDSQLGAGAITKGGLIQTMLSAAHQYAGDPTFGWKPQLLDNKVVVVSVHAIQIGVDYNSPSNAITQTVSIAQAITPADTSAAVALIGLGDHVFI